jgi:hypothetical protein
MDYVRNHRRGIIIWVGGAGQTLDRPPERPARRRRQLTGADFASEEWCRRYLFITCHHCRHRMLGEFQFGQTAAAAAVAYFNSWSAPGTQHIARNACAGSAAVDAAACVR